MAAEQSPNEDHFIDIDLTDKEWAQLVLNWMYTHLSPQSVAVAREQAEQGCTLQDAVFAAVRNQAVIDALIEVVKFQEKTNE